MKLGDKFLKAINSIYSTQIAQIKVNDELTEEFEVQKGTRQGCPLSPLVFILILEILLKKIQRDQEFKGIRVKGNSFKYKAFANDMVFFSEEPKKTFIKLLELLNEFGKLAGLYINRNKSKILVKNIKKEE